MVQHYANEAARVVQHLCNFYRVPGILFYCIANGRPALFVVDKRLQTSHSTIVQPDCRLLNRRILKKASLYPHMRYKANVHD